MNLCGGTLFQSEGNSQDLFRAGAMILKSSCAFYATEGAMIIKAAGTVPAAFPFQVMFVIAIDQRQRNGLIPLPAT